MKLIKFYNGLEIPLIGMGSFKGLPGELEKAISDAINAGYRHFDCAWFYGNEAEIGVALKQVFDSQKVKRDDIFITSKLWNNFHDRKNVIPKLKETLKSLQINYIDLFLIHWPMGFKEEADLLPSTSEAYSDVDYLETWQGMEDCVKQGLAKSIGVSNFNIQQLDRLLENCEIKPAVNQIEVNPNMNQKDLREHCKAKDIVVTAFCPLGRNLSAPSATGQPVSTLADPVVLDIAKKYNKTAAQVVLRYLVNLGISVIPKSVNKNRLIENIDIFDFDLDEQEASYLDSRNKNIRVSPMTAYKDHKYYPFEK